VHKRFKFLGERREGEEEKLVVLEGKQISVS
jgi:hypothetical protein